MALTDNLRRQHDELVSIVTSISNHISTESSVTEKAGEIRQLLSKLAGKLKMHLAMEDKILYPKILNNGDDAGKKTAKNFLNEMGQIGDVFKTYIDTYSTEKEIKHNPNDFINNTVELFKSLADRIEKENKILYPIADHIQ